MEQEGDAYRGDYFRTRLTHTIEVAQVARTIAGALGLNTDLAEAVALAHDLGHPPFGHTGEDALAALMAPMAASTTTRRRCGSSRNWNATMPASTG